MELEVSDGLLNDTASGQTLVVNRMPIAIAGDNQEVIVASEITLDGTLSFDLDNDNLTYQWQLINKPENSVSELINANSPSPMFIPDLIGEYTIGLVVNDGEENSVIDEVMLRVKAGNVSPIAVASYEGTLETNSIISLNGTSSSDPDDGPQALSFQWSIIMSPSISTALISNSDQAVGHFTPDIAGDYQLLLTVFDGTDSHTDILNLTILEGEVPTMMCDVNADSSIDKSDILTIMSRRNTPASTVNDLADWDHDGMITVLDARGCVRQCSLPRCAVP